MNLQRVLLLLLGAMILIPFVLQPGVAQVRAEAKSSSVAVGGYDPHPFRSSTRGRAS